jgi:transposase
LHKEQSWFYVSDHEGKRLISKSIPNSEKEPKRIFESIPKPFKLGVEATRNWYFFVDLAELYAEEVNLAEPFALKAFAKRNKKTDKIDAKLICDVLRIGFLPKVNIAPKLIREIREILKYRMSLVYERNYNINRLKNTLGKLGHECNGMHHGSIGRSIAGVARELEGNKKTRQEVNKIARLYTGK